MQNINYFLSKFLFLISNFNFSEASRFTLHSAKRESDSNSNWLHSNFCVAAFSLSFSLLVSPLPAAVVTTPAITVSASLSRDRLPAGEMAQLDVKVTGTQQADLPKELTVNGLKIRLSGQSSQVQMINYSISSSVIYSYIVMPLGTGTFTIPAIPVRVQGKYFQTTPLQLTVVGSGNQGNSGAPATLNGIPIPNGATSALAPANSNDDQSEPSSNDQITFGELSVAKKKFYVGEMVPAEIRFYVDAHYNAEPRSDVLLNEEGLLVERLTKPKASVVQRNGKSYNMVTLQTLISAVKPGQLEMTPAALDILVGLPTALPPGTPDIIAQMMRRAGGPSQTKQIKVTTNKLSLEVLPLPLEGKPDGFSGAVGEFNLTASASPLKLPAGDPETLSLRLEGKGNFKGLQPPQLTETQGWRLYPPSDRFEQNDNLGWSGVKTFETTMIAQQSVAATPGAIFSYFNPNTAKYVVLTTKPIALEQPTASSPPPTPAANNVPPAKPPVSPSPQDQALKSFSSQSWQSPFYRKNFLMAWSAALAAVFLCSCTIGIAYRRRAIALRDREKLQMKKLWEQLHDKNCEPVLFFNKAAEYAALLLKQDSSKNDAVKTILRRRDEINYGAREIVLKETERQQILEQLS